MTFKLPDPLGYVSQHTVKGHKVAAVKTVVETEDWKLGAFMEWRPISRQKTCPRCEGLKTGGDGFKWLDGPQDCPECLGRGYIWTEPTTKMPELPADLREHMRRAWWDFFNLPDPKKDTP